MSSALDTADDVKSFTSWKLDIQNAMGTDPRLSPTDTRIANRVMAAVNQGTREAFITDKTICADVANINRFSCNRARKKLADTGWWSCILGRYGQATVYRFSNENVQAMRNRRAFNREAHTAHIEAVHTAHIDSVHSVSPSAHCEPLSVSPSAPCSVSLAIPLHLQATPSGKKEGAAGESLAHPHVRELVIQPGPDATIEMLRAIGQGSWVQGSKALDVLEEPRRKVWFDRARSHGLSARELGKLKDLLGVN